MRSIMNNKIFIIIYKNDTIKNQKYIKKMTAKMLLKFLKILFRSQLVALFLDFIPYAVGVSV